MWRHHDQQIVGNIIIVQTLDDLLFRIDGAHDELIILLDPAPFAFRVHPNDRLMSFASWLGLTGKIFDLDAIANAFVTEIAVEHPLRLVGRRRAAIRPDRYADDYPTAAKICQAVTQANR